MGQVSKVIISFIHLVFWRSNLRLCCLNRIFVTRYSSFHRNLFWMYHLSWDFPFLPRDFDAILTFVNIFSTNLWFSELFSSVCHYLFNLCLIHKRQRGPKITSSWFYDPEGPGHLQGSSGVRGSMVRPWWTKTSERWSESGDDGWTSAPLFASAPGRDGTLTAASSAFLRFGVDLRRKYWHLLVVGCHFCLYWKDPGHVLAWKYSRIQKRS